MSFCLPISRDWKASLSDASSDPDEDWFNGRLQAARSEAASIRQFKKVLGDMVEKATIDGTLPPSASTGSGEEVPSSQPRKAPLIFIIDELDRCKPSFALSVLECMKHVFSANGVCFVLVTNLVELTAMVKHTYGLEHPERYLEKFYHLRVDIESLLSLSRIERRGRYLEHLTGTMNAPTLSNSRHAQVMIKELARISHTVTAEGRSGSVGAEFLPREQVEQKQAALRPCFRGARGAGTAA